MTITLGYWGIRGRGEAARLILRYSGAEWEDKIYASPAEYGAFKTSTDMAFPNLPYLIDGDVKMSETVAILRYLGRKFDLSPSNADAWRVEMIEQVFVDWVAAFLKVAFDKANFEESSAKFKEGLGAKLDKLGGFIGERKWIAGDKLTYVDFLAFELLSVIQMFSPDSHNKVVDDYLARFAALGPIKKWLESDERKQRAFHVLPPNYAAWSGAPN